MGGFGAARAPGQCHRTAPVPSQAEAEHGLGGLLDVQLERHLDRRARIQAHAQAPRQALAQQRRRPAHVAVAAEKLDAVAGHGARTGVGVGVEKRDAALEFGVVGIARGQHAAVAVDLGHHVHLGLGMQVAEDPFDVAGGGQPARTAGAVVQLEHAELHRVLEADVHP